MSLDGAPVRGGSGRLIILGLALAVATIAVYANHFDNPFHFDDAHTIEQNAYVRDIGNVPQFFTDPATRSTLPANRGYRPLFMVTLAVDHWLAGGLDLFYFHLSTFFWFLVQGVLMYLLYAQVLARATDHAWTRPIALLTVGWYWLHPANAETINYVSARSDSLSTLCVVAGLVIWSRNSSWKRQLAGIPVVLGILIKPTAVMFTPLALAWAVLVDLDLPLREAFAIRHRRALARRLLELTPIAVISLCTFVFTMQMTPDTWAPGGPSSWLYAITQPFMILRYFWLAFLPLDLTADTDWRALAGIADWRFWLGSSFLIALLTVAGLASERRWGRPIAFGIAWFLIALVPSSSVVPLAEVTNDHRVFYPYVGLFLAIGWSVGLLGIRIEAWLSAGPRRRAGAVAAIGLVLATYAAGTYARNEVWGSSETLWRDVTVKSPANGRGLMNYGLALMRRADYVGALEAFEKALDLGYGRHPYLQVNLAIVKEELGRSDEVEPHYRRALRSELADPACHYWYASWLTKRSRLAEARTHVEQALAASPGHASALALRARLDDEPEKDLAESKRAPERTRSPERLLQLSFDHYQAGRHLDSIRVAEQALALRSRYAAAYNNICAAYNALGRWSEGVAACERALAIEPEYELARNNLAWARSMRARKPDGQAG